MRIFNAQGKILHSKLQPLSKWHVVATLFVPLLISCGGGGGGGSGASSISASPALGCFEDGTEVRAYDMQGGQLTTGTVNSCNVSLSLGSHSGPFILKTMPGKRYFDESTGALSAVAYSGNGILSVVPSVTANKNYALNVLTNLVAAQAGIDPAAPSMAGVADPAAAIAAAKTDVLAFLGVSEATLGGDIFASPTVLKGDNALTGAISGSNLYAALLADLAASSTGSPGTQADDLFSLVKQAKAASSNTRATLLVSLSNTLVGSLTRLSSGSSPIFSKSYLGNGITKATTLDMTAIKAAAESAIKTNASVSSVSLIVGTQEPVQTVVTSAGIVVAPDLGRFSAKALVEAYNAQTGVLIPGASALTDANGLAAVELGGYSGSVVLKVSGGTNVTYYDEGLGKDTAFTSSDVMLGMIPATAIKNQTYYSVNPLTHMAAAFAGLTASNLKVTAADNKTVDQVLYESLARVRYMLGLSYATLGEGEARLMLNPLTATSPLSATNASSGINTSLSGGYWSLFFAELARSATTSTSLLKPSIWELAKATNSEILAAAGSYNSLQNSDNMVLIKKAAVEVGNGTSSFLSKCTLASSTLTTAMNDRFKNANTNIKLSPSESELSQMVEELKFSIGLIQNKGQNPTSVSARTLSTCPP